MTERTNDPLDPQDALDPQDPGLEIIEVDASEDEELPYELRDDAPARTAEPKTGLVSEFRDLSSGNAAYLVSHRETTAVARSPLFYVTTLVIGLAVLIGLLVGVRSGAPQANAGGDMPTLAMVGVGENAALFEQQYGIKAVDVESVEAGQELLRSGEADGLLVQDQTGMVDPYILANDSEPTELLEILSPQMEVQYLQAPLVPDAAYTAFGWGMALLLVVGAMTLGAALYSNARLEKRHRIAEILAATIPPRAAAWGRVYGLTVLSLVYPLVALVVLLVGLSIVKRPTMAVDILPAMGWFAGLFLVDVLMFLAAYLWVSTAAGRRTRQIFYGVTVLLVVAGAFVPMVFSRDWDMLRILSYVPFTSPVATPLLFLGNQAEWWQGVVAIAIVLAMGLVIFALGAASYQRTLLRGSGRGGKTAAAKKGAKKSVGAAAGKASGGKGSAGKASGQADDAGTEDDVTEDRKISTQGVPEKGDDDKVALSVAAGQAKQAEQKAQAAADAGDPGVGSDDSFTDGSHRNAPTVDGSASAGPDDDEPRGGAVEGGADKDADGSGKDADGSDKDANGSDKDANR